MSVFNKGMIYDPESQELKIKGVQPRRQFVFRIYKVALGGAILCGILALLTFGIVGFVNLENEEIKKWAMLIGFIGMLGLSIFLVSFAMLLKLTLLKKAPFDNWVYEIAASSLGTKVILYDGKRIFIQYDRNNKEVDKKDFILKMAERSEKYSYFLINTWIDEGFLEVACTTKQPIPTRAPKKEEDDKFFNIVPLGLGLNNITKKISPVGWYINTENKNKEMIETLPAISLAIVGTSGSGKSVCLNNIMAHISKFPEQIQAVGIDLKQVEFTQFRGLKGFKSVAWDIYSAAELTTAFRRIMDKRFAMMRENKVNNIFKIKDLEVDYYTLGGVDYQFDEIFEVTRDLDTKDRNYKKLANIYLDGRQATIMTIEELYNGIKDGSIKNPQIPERKGLNSWLDIYSIRKTKGMFKPKLNICLVDELNELMTNGDYNSVDTIRGNFGSLCRLGRSAGIHSVFAMQNANGQAMSGDMRTNISMSIIFGDFDSGASTNLFERDYSNMSRPEIKGRGILNSGKDIIEFQGYYADEIDSWYFDESLKWTYENPIFDRQCEKRGVIPDPTGFVEQVRPEVREEEQVEEDFSPRGGKFDKKFENKDFGMDSDFSLDDLLKSVESEMEATKEVKPTETPKPESKGRTLKFNRKK